LQKLKRQAEEQELSITDRLLASAELYQFTGSVNVRRRPPAGQPHQSEDPSPLPSAKQIRVVTSSSLSIADDGTTSHEDVVDAHISVQPLLILDLNGILCHRIRPYKEPAYKLYPYTYRPAIARNVANTSIIPRTDLVPFLTFLDRHFCLAVWTSAKARTANQLLRLLVPTSIAGRLLFVWAQHHCEKFEPSPDDGSDFEAGIPQFRKDLSRVWREFPLWNSTNTLLMDDSPDKCVAWRENAVHPPPLHGRVVQGPAFEHLHGDALQLPVQSDEENEAEQRIFFESLARHWSEAPAVAQDWESESGDATLRHVDRLSKFLWKHALGHMGWHPPKRK
jgi:hypothetical protein